MEETKKTTKPAAEKKPQSPRKPASVIIKELKEELAEQKAYYEKRIVEKQREGNIIASECEDKLANKDLIIRGLQSNLGKAEARIEELTDRLAKSAIRISELEVQIKGQHKRFLGILRRNK